MERVSRLKENIRLHLLQWMQWMSIMKTIWKSGIPMMRNISVRQQKISIRQKSQERTGGRKQVLQDMKEIQLHLQEMDLLMDGRLPLHIRMQI